MAYICKDCSYRGKRGGELGGCPACGSFNMVLEGAEPAGQDKPPGNPALRMKILVGLWVFFFALVIFKLLE